MGSPKGRKQAVFWLGHRKHFVGTGLAISVVFGINGLGNQPLHLVGAPFPVLKAQFSARLGCHGPRNLIEIL